MDNLILGYKYTCSNNYYICMYFLFKAKFPYEWVYSEFCIKNALQYFTKENLSRAQWLRFRSKDRNCLPKKVLKNMISIFSYWKIFGWYRSYIPGAYSFLHETVLELISDDKALIVAEYGSYRLRFYDRHFWRRE